MGRAKCKLIVRVNWMFGMLVKKDLKALTSSQFRMNDNIQNQTIAQGMLRKGELQCYLLLKSKSLQKLRQDFQHTE